jgi:hypothetical protein
LNTCLSEARKPKIVFKKVYVLGEQYLLEQHLIRTKDGEDAVPKGIINRLPTYRPVAALSVSLPGGE